LKEIASLKRF